MTAAAHCPGCGYDNNPQYKFCGMCGTALQAGAATAKTPRRNDAAPLSVGGYSILGLAPEPANKGSFDVSDLEDKVSQSSLPQPGAPKSRPLQSAGNSIIQNDAPFNPSLDYLFEDNEKKPDSRWRLYVALALLVIAAGVLVWQWQRNGYPWDDLSPLSWQNDTLPITKPAADAKPIAAPIPPANNPNVAPEAEKPAAGAPSATQNPPSAAADSPAAESAKADAPKEQLQPVPGTQEDSLAAKTAERSDATQPKDENNSPSEESTASDVQSQAAAAQGEIPAVVASGEIPAEASSPAQALALLSEGTKYLLGNGVPQDCDRAQKALRAASRYSSEADSTLGTMYASGHCVGRDLPTAYHWYARALHNQPQNSRFQNDLTVLWNQMTPAERKLASRSGE